MKNEKTIRLSIILSLLIHAAMTALLWIQPVDLHRLTEKKENTPVEVELVDSEKLLEQMKGQQVQPAAKGQIVEQDEKRLNDEVPKDARFLSRHDQTVVRETQAKLHGKFKNSDESSGEKTPEQKVGKEAYRKESEERPEKTDIAKNEKELITSPDGIPTTGARPALKDLIPSFKPTLPPLESQDLAQGGGQGPSSTDDRLQNVATGMQTLLSTREFVYYSYYNRIKAKLRQYWEPKIKEKMERIVRQGRQIASTGDKVTKIVIVLDKEGTLTRVQIISTSGVHDLDEAAIEAFRAAAPFPNPPKGIIDADGTIKIRWDFILEANNRSNSLLNAMRVAQAGKE